jgi:RNA recognition motif-containing protein
LFTHRGFAFIVFTEKSAVDRVLEAAGPLNLDGRDVDVKKAIPHQRHQVKERV